MKKSIKAIVVGIACVAAMCCLTLAITVLPVIMRTTEETLIAVSDAYREGSFGLEAGRLRTVVKVILPPAMPGILGGIILAIGRIVGESAALIYTAGTVASFTGGLFSSARTLSVHMYVLASGDFTSTKPMRPRWFFWSSCSPSTPWPTPSAIGS